MLPRRSCVRTLFHSLVLIYLLALRSTRVTSLHHYYGQLRLPRSYFGNLVFCTCTTNTPILGGETWISWVPSLISTNSLTPATPEVGVHWIHQNDLLSTYCLLCYQSHRLLRQLLLRGYHVHHLVSARMFRCLRFALVVTFQPARLAMQ